MKPQTSFKAMVATALEVRALVRKLSSAEVARCFRGSGGFAILCRHTFRPGWWRVHYLDGVQEPIASADAPTYSEGLYLAYAAGADLRHLLGPLPIKESHARAAGI